MKKIIAILITMTMLFSLVSIPAFASSDRGTEVWSHDFETTGFSVQGNISYGQGPDANIGGNATKAWGLKKNSGGANTFLSGTVQDSSAGKLLSDCVTLTEGSYYMMTIDVYPKKPASAYTGTNTTVANHLNSPTRLVTFGLKTSTGTADSNFAATTKTLKNVPVEQWTTISTPVFSYANNMTYIGVNANVGASTTSDREILYMDNLKIIKIENASYIKAGANEVTYDFDDDTPYISGIDFVGNSTNAPVVTDAKSYTPGGRSLYFEPAYTQVSRLIFPDIFTADNVNQTYKITFKIFPVNYDSSKEYELKLALKSTTDTNSNWYGSAIKTYTITNNAPSDTNIKAGQWNEISYVANGNTTYKHIGFTFDIPNIGNATTACLPYYLDEITITPLDYFVPQGGSAVSTTADAGYYAASEDAEAEEGVIGITAYISDSDDTIGAFSNFGIYVYVHGDESANATASLANSTETRAALKDAQGYINALIEGISPNNFGAKVVAMPFVKVGNKMHYGEAIEYCVNDAAELKWLGEKPVEADAE